MHDSIGCGVGSGVGAGEGAAVRLPKFELPLVCLACWTPFASWVSASNLFVGALVAVCVQKSCRSHACVLQSRDSRTARL